MKEMKEMKDPQFTLTAEEVKEPPFSFTAEEIREVKCAIVDRIHDLNVMCKYYSNPDVFLLEGIKICENLLKRLNDYGKEV